MVGPLKDKSREWAGAKINHGGGGKAEINHRGGGGKTESKFTEEDKKLWRPSIFFSFPNHHN